MLSVYRSDFNRYAKDGSLAKVNHCTAVCVFDRGNTDPGQRPSRVGMSSRALLHGLRETSARLPLAECLRLSTLAVGADGAVQGRV